MLLGKGGFASVQLATHAISAEQVAVKRVRNSPVARREVELMRSLPTNAHLLPLIDVFETNGELILALPLCSGGSLQAIADQVRADRALAPSENDILRWFHHTCIAVAALHDRGIAHRDLKPANVLLRRTDRREALLCDFGSASAARVTVSNADQVMELADDVQEFTSMSFRAPELFDLVSGITITEAIDTWALGCLLYAVCFGINPFDAVLLRGGSVELAIRNVVMDVPEHGAKAFPRCVAIIRALLVADVDARPTARHLCQQTRDFD
jgi:serine/threonine kinase 16